MPKQHTVAVLIDIRELDSWTKISENRDGRVAGTGSV
jgi:hypothetical protein